MKTKSKTNIMHFLVLCIISVFAFGCAQEDYELSSVSNSLSYNTYYSHQWSKTTKKDTTILLCLQNVKMENVDENFSSTVMIKLYKQKDSVYFNEKMSPSPICENKVVTSNKKDISSNKTKHTIKKEFFFNDGEIVYADITFYSQKVELENSTLTLPYMSITSVDFNTSNLQQDKNKENQYHVVLDFDVNWQIVGKNDDGNENASIEYEKIKIYDQDELLNTSYTKGYNWINEEIISLFVEKIESWKIAGEKKTKYTSPPLEIKLLTSGYKTLEVANFDFRKELFEETKNEENISKDNWDITKHLITQTLRYTNNTDTFDDVFSYFLFDVSFMLDEKVFNFDLGVEFSVDNELTTINQHHKSNKTSAKLRVASKEFVNDIVTVLKLKSNDEPNDEPTDEPVDEDLPKHGRIISHFVSAIYDVDNSTTKKCVVVRYEKGYDWGVCEYEEFFPTTFTYTQTGYSGFNSVAQTAKGQPFRLARAIDTKDAIYWYQENNKLISAIDFLSCKVIGWKNKKNGMYCSTMEGYEENYSSNGYTLKLTAPDGSTKTFKSSKRN